MASYRPPRNQFKAASKLNQDALGNCFNNRAFSSLILGFRKPQQTTASKGERTNTFHRHYNKHQAKRLASRSP